MCSATSSCTCSMAGAAGTFKIAATFPPDSLMGGLLSGSVNGLARNASRREGYTKIRYTGTVVA